MTGGPSSPVPPRPDERGLASWEPADLAGLVLPAWDDFIDIVAGLDLDAASRVRGWTARDICVHLGSWPGSRSLQRMREEAEHGDVSRENSRAGTFDVGTFDVGTFDVGTFDVGTFDQESHNEAVLEAWSAAPRRDVLAALEAARAETSEFLASPEAVTLGPRAVRSVLGPLPLSTLVGAAVFELAVHALDLRVAAARAPSADLLSAGVAALVDTTGALAARAGITTVAACISPEGGWAFSASPGAWTTLELPEVAGDWPTVAGAAADLLDASAGRRSVPPMLARRELRLHHVGGLLALAPIVENVPGLPGGSALRAAVRNVRTVNRLVRRLPGVPG